MVRIQSASYGTAADAPAAPRRHTGKKLAAVVLLSMAAVAATVLFASLESEQEEMAGQVSLLNYDEKNQNFPDWSHPGLPANNDRSAVNGRWTMENDGPPYVAPLTMYSGDGVDRDGSGNYVRRILGIKRQWRFHHWNTNNFVKTFESQQMRFFSRNKNSFLVIPPLSEMPVLSGGAARLLNNYLLYGGNTIIVCGSVSSVLFLNMNLPSWDFHGYSLESMWHAGPYEQQKTTYGSRFEHTATTLPGDGVWGVDINSLPKEAVSYYEAPGVSVVFSLPAKTGKIIYIGFNYEEQNAAWAEVLQAAIRDTPAE